jgi:hypothetical protein
MRSRLHILAAAALLFACGDDTSGGVGTADAANDRQAPGDADASLDLSVGDVGEEAVEEPDADLAETSADTEDLTEDHASGEDTAEGDVQRDPATDADTSVDADATQDPSADPAGDESGDLVTPGCAPFERLASPELIALTPRGVEEAEGLALSVDRDDLVASTVRYDRSKSDLEIIRTGEWDSDIEAMVGRIYYRAPYALHRLIVGFERESDIVGYEAWDCANAYYKGTPNYDRIGFGSIQLEFDARYNLAMLASLYAGLDDPIRYAEVDYLIGDGPTVCAAEGVTSNAMDYFFIDAFGDCPAGCISRVFYYFTSSTSGEIAYLGTYDPSDDGAEAPGWITRANACRRGE